MTAKKVDEMGKQRFPTSLGDKLRGMLIQPNQTMAAVAPNLSPDVSPPVADKEYI